MFYVVFLIRLARTTRSWGMQEQGGRAGQSEQSLSQSRHRAQPRGQAPFLDLKRPREQFLLEPRNTRSQQGGTYSNMVPTPRKRPAGQAWRFGQDAGTECAVAKKPLKLTNDNKMREWKAHRQNMKKARSQSNVKISNKANTAKQN